ncbi:MFS transporter [Mycobacterium stomatepiae]|uniref:MFS transporter n=2 Tax=Mycobacterium stomatepiae TaxID=470076 RepID=A0A7I7QFL9_9MYCO|nr:MFS transporter [Mycobacterium stomatepiae]
MTGAARGATSGSAGGTRRAGPSRADMAADRKFLGPSGPLRRGNPWHALWAMIIGFFMIMVDSTIVAIANPTIMADLHIGYDAVVWVTSAYLLGYAVVLLVAGRLGDRFGSKNLYVIGLVVFTVASMWCGLAGSAGMLITARVVQGVGAGVLTPQTLSTITRIFPPHRRGVAVSVWGATAGVASLVGPLAGGVLVDGLGWEWIFFVNVPIGLAGLALAMWLVPELPIQAHRFDLVGVALSGAGMFLVVFGLQQGQSAHWQSVNTREPLIPLEVFADRDFSLCSVGVGITSFAATALMLPVTFYTQLVCGLSPTRSAWVIAPMAIANGVLAPFVGRIVDRYHPRPVLGFGFSVLAIALTWLSFEMSPDTPIWRLGLPFTAVGVGMAFVWSPLTATATRNLAPQLAGTGSAVYNSVRQLGAVLGSAATAAFMTWRIGAEMPPDVSDHDAGDGAIPLQLPEFVREPFSAAMSQSVLLPAFITLFGICAALFLVGFASSTMSRAGIGGGPSDYDDWVDDDDYVEVILRREDGGVAPDAIAPAEVHYSDPVEPCRRRRDDPPSRPEPIGFAHNGSHANRETRFRPVVELPAHWQGPATRSDRSAPSPGRGVNGSTRAAPGQRYDPDPDDDARGRHSSGR